jgi:hypothetical protein
MISFVLKLRVDLIKNCSCCHLTVGVETSEEQRRKEDGKAEK